MDNRSQVISLLPLQREGYRWHACHSARLRSKLRSEIEGFIVHQAEEVKVTLSLEHLQVVRESIESGEFATLSEAIQDAVETWKRCRIEEAQEGPRRPSSRCS